MKRIFACILCLLIPFAAAMAQEAKQEKTEAKAPEAKLTEALPSVDKILDKFVEAVGGKAAIEKITSRQIKGNFDLPAMGASGTVQLYSKAPDKSAIIIDIPGFGLIQQAYDGKIAWENNPMVGMRDITGPSLAARKRDSDFYRDIKLKELYGKLEVKSKQKVGDRDAYVIEATPAEGKAEMLYFDVENGLLIRQDAEREGAEGPVLTEVYMENYKEVDGVKMPTTIRQVMPQMTIIIKLDEIKHNVEIDDAKFAKPVAPVVP